MSEKDYLLINNYELKEDIGEGNFGKVKLGIFKKTGEEFAIKIINKEKLKLKMKNVLFKENEIITKFNHINVVYVFQIIEDETDFYIVMEYCNKGELFDYIVTHKKLDEDEASIFFYQLINGIDYIHKKGFVHRDLKPENLLLTSDKTLKIIDFGLSHEYEGGSLLKTKCGSPSYASPEIIQGQSYNGFKIDIWCCGIILYAMLCGYLPFEGDNNKELYSNILKCNPEYPSFLSKKSKELIQNLLKINPDERLTIEQIKNTDFYLNGKKQCKIDYNLIEDKLEKRETFYGDGKKKFKNFFNINSNNSNINNEKKEEHNEVLSRNSDNINKYNKKINLIHLITDSNNDEHINEIKQKILKKNSHFQKKVELLNNKLDYFLQTEANENNNIKMHNDLIDKKNNINLFNYKNNNSKHLIGKQNIYEERFQNKNNGCFINLKKNNKNSVNLIENTDKTSHNKTKKFFKQFVSPISEKLTNRKKIISPYVNDFSKNNLNEYKKTETINLEKKSNDFFSNNNSDKFRSRTLNINRKNNEYSINHANLFNKINIKNLNKDKNKENEDDDHKNPSKIYQKNSNRNNSEEKHRNYSNDLYNKNTKYNYNHLNTDNARINEVVNNLNVIWKNNFNEKGKNAIIKSPSNKNYRRKENLMEIENIDNNYNKSIKNNNIEKNLENFELYKKNSSLNNKNNKKNIKFLKTMENLDKPSKKNLFNNNKLNYRSKSRDNEKKNINKNFREKYDNNKDTLPLIDIHMKLNN